MTNPFMLRSTHEQEVAVRERRIDALIAGLVDVIADNRVTKETLRQAIAELRQEKSKNDALVRHYGQRFDFGLNTKVPVHLAGRVKFYKEHDTLGRTDIHHIHVPAVTFAFMVDLDYVAQLEARCLPQIGDIYADQFGTEYGRKVTELLKEVLKKGMQ